MAGNQSHHLQTKENFMNPSKSSIQPAPVPLIPRKVLFGNPDRASVQISHDGRFLSWLAPRDGVLNVWIAPRDNPTAARPVTHDTGRGIRYYFWAYTNTHLLYIQDKNGDENWRIYAVDLEQETVRDLTPFEGVQAQIMATSPEEPEVVIVGLNKRKPEWHDIYRLHLPSGRLSLLLEHNRFMGINFDNNLNMRLAEQMAPDGSVEVYKFTRPSPGNGDCQLWDRIPTEDTLTTSMVGFDRDNRTIFFKDSRGRNTSALLALDVKTKEKKILAENRQADVGDVVRHPSKKNVQAVSFTYERKSWEILDPSIQPELEYLKTVADGDVEINSRTLDDHYWIVVYVLDNRPISYYLYDRQRRQATFLFTNRAALEDKPLVRMYSSTIQSRDGLDLVVYYSLPPGSDTNTDGLPDQPVPAILIPHGGPWGRDFWGFDTWHQWLANRGYAVINVNFRSSTGFGKAFVNAGDRQWGEKIIEDQQDAVHWAIERRIADPNKFAVMGGSFGGYSTLAGLTFTPELFTCGVDLVGPSNLITLLESIPPYWKPTLELFTTRVGDFRTEKGRQLLVQHSPLHYADRICKPLLIGQGANDPRVKQAESDQIVSSLQEKGIPVTYVLYPDEGHGFARPENNLSFNAIAEAFLAKCLGGRFEPVGEDLKGSSLKVITGVEDIPGLEAALENQQE
jgi:dipeptidyl aminopeptidase/acylaminoacyl peptidase